MGDEWHGKVETGGFSFIFLSSFKEWEVILDSGSADSPSH